MLLLLIQESQDPFWLQTSKEMLEDSMKIRDRKGFLILERMLEFVLTAKKPGHTIDKCYRIHEFPTNFKFTKQRNFQRNVHANAVFNTNEERIQGNTYTTGTQSLTQENVAQLLQLLQQVNIGQQVAGTSEASANLSYAGITKIFNSFALFFGHGSFTRASWFDSVSAEVHP